MVGNGSEDTAAYRRHGTGQDGVALWESGSSIALFQGLLCSSVFLKPCALWSGIHSSGGGRTGSQNSLAPLGEF